jgi:hypothetical protein
MLRPGIASLVPVDVAEVPGLVGINEAAAAGAVDDALSDLARPTLP